MIDDKQTEAICETIAVALTEQGYSVETRGSVVYTRGYIGVSKESTDEYYVIQVDKN